MPLVRRKEVWCEDLQDHLNLVLPSLAHVVLMVISFLRPITSIAFVPDLAHVRPQPPHVCYSCLRARS